MAEIHKLIDSDFEQPIETPYLRKVSGLEEEVDFLQGSHVRIWYNTDIVSYDMHYHNALEIIYMYESDTLIKLTDRDVLLKTGDIIFIPPYVTHQTKCLHPNKQFVLMLDITTLSDFSLGDFIKKPVNNILLCGKNDPIYESVCNQIVDMINIYFTNEPYWELSLFSSFLSLAVIISKAHLLQEGTSVTASLPSPANNKEHYDKFTELMQYIDNNFSEPLTLDFISSHVGFSKYHFIRLFKEYTGSTFYDYLTNKRIQHAQYLLETEPDMGITDIAFSCGFNNQTSFCRCFKNIVGCPPTEYRSNKK